MYSKPVFYLWNCGKVTAFLPGKLDDTAFLRGLNDLIYHDTYQALFRASDMLPMLNKWPWLLVEAEWREDGEEGEC